MNIRKSTGTTKYFKSELKREVDDIKKDMLTYTAASKMYHIFKLTLYIYSKGVWGIKSDSIG